MKGPFRNKGGFSLLEVIVSIALLGIMAAPICASLVLSHRLNAESEKTLQDRLKVESAVEQLMAEGIQYDSEKEISKRIVNIEIDAVDVEVYSVKYIEENEEKKEVWIPHTDSEFIQDSWYKVVVKSKDGEVAVETVIRGEEPPEEKDEPTDEQNNGGGT